ncbi:TonB-dependent receptor [Aestuariivivens sediminis]|uniref:TonB-dependent receptor n=1 Tax=Aestuariivivens sediminis TaxID=2913557 RepID=UPI0030B81F8B
MNRNVWCMGFGFFSVCMTFAQSTLIKGIVKEALTQHPVINVRVTIEETGQTVRTNQLGAFQFISHLPLGEQTLKISKDGYVTKRYPIVVNENQEVNMDSITLEKDVSSLELYTIILSDDALNEDSNNADNISGLLVSSRDMFQKAVAFEFSPSFFKVRGLNSDHGTVLINGIEMNKLYHGRPQWSNWGGINDVMRNQELTWGLSPSRYNFGGVLGTTNINLRASQSRPGFKITYSSSNRSYVNRLMATYISGWSKNNWSLSLSLGTRWGHEGYQKGTLYESQSFFASIEKKINDKHDINFLTIYAPNKRGKSSPNTQEVYDLKGRRYSEYWGYLNGEIRNSRIKDVKEPIFILNHYWTVSPNLKWNTNIGYQSGRLGNSRLDYSAGANPSPVYYQKLPSYALSDPEGPNYALAYQLEQRIITYGQIDWSRIFDANLTNNTSGLNAAYGLYEDRTDDKQWTINSILSSKLNEHIQLNASVQYKTLISENFAEVINLLGSNVGLLNVDPFNRYQYDAQNPDRLVGKGEKYRYSYNLFGKVISGFGQGQFNFKKIDLYLAGRITQTKYQREGLWEHSRFPGSSSLGKGREWAFTGIGIKTGLTYKFSGKHILNINTGYITKAPNLQNIYTNVRENHDVVKHMVNEKVMNGDVSYHFRSPFVKAKLTGYYITIYDAIDVSGYYADGLSASGRIEDNRTSAFVQEVLQGINEKHLGLELGIEAQVTPTIKLKGASSVGQYTYNNNPNLYLTSSSFTSADGTVAYGKSYLKNYKIAGGPQRAYSLGFEYRDPDNWWFGATINVFSNAYLDINKLIRTSNFYLDEDGLPFNNYDEDLVSVLLKQEKFNPYIVGNLIGGKSWRIGDQYISAFISVNNVLDNEFKTGGFEQGRNSNYKELREDLAGPKQVFGPKYWFGRGATYFFNMNIQF